MNINILPYSLFGIAGGQEVDHTLVKFVVKLLIVNLHNKFCKFHLPFSYSVFSYFISASATVCYFVTTFFRSAARVVICCYSRTREGEFVFGVYFMYLFSCI